MYRLYLVLFTALASARSSSEAYNTPPSKLHFNNQVKHSIEQSKGNQIVENQNDLVTDNYILSIIKNQNNDKIKKALDHFTMERRKTHFDIPGNLINNDHLKNVNNIHKSDVKKFNAFEDSSKSYFYKDPKLFNMLRKQTVLMTKLLQILKDDTDIQRIGKKQKLDAFDQLLKAIDYKHKITSQEELIVEVTHNNMLSTSTPAPSTTKILSTVMTMIDETEVRRALKNDPYIKRILKLASRKREKYLNSVKNNTK